MTSFTDKSYSEIGPIPSPWDVVTVDDIKDSGKSVISGPFGSNISSKFFVNSGIPVIRGNNLSLNAGIKFIDEDFVYVTTEKAEELNTWASNDDLIFTAVGTIGQVGLLNNRNKYDKYIISNKQLRLTVNKKKIDPLFAYYWFSTPFMQENIISNNTGSSVPLINLGILKSLPIPIPALDEQRAIASVLSSLDDKIDLLHRQNATLEAMAAALFKQWFVVKAKGEWEEYTVENIAKQLTETTNPLLFPDLLFSLYSIPAYDLNKNPELSYGKHILSNKFLINDNCILVSKLNPKFPRIWLLLENNLSNAISSTEFIPIIPFDKHNLPFLYCLFASDRVIQELTNAASGTSGSHQRVRPDDILNITFMAPSLKYLSEFSNSILSFFKKISFNHRRISTLEKLRDALLPKLMSGEVRVRF